MYTTLINQKIYLVIFNKSGSPRETWQFIFLFALFKSLLVKHQNLEEKNNNKLHNFHIFPNYIIL